MSRVKKIIMFILIFLLSAVALISAFMIWRELSEREKEKKDFAALAEIVYQPYETETGAEEGADNTNGAESGSDKSKPHTRNLAPLYEQNSDFYGWLCVPGTALDYPVMYTPNDPQKYLRMNFYCEYSISGIPFVDYRWVEGSDNLIIYGHDMLNDTMFGSLKRYEDREYFEEYSTIEWETGEGLEVYEVFAVMYVHKTDDWYNFIDAPDEAAFEDWMEYIRSRAVVTGDDFPVYGQKLLTLSTCHGSGNDGRMLVVAMEK